MCAFKYKHPTSSLGQNHTHALNIQITQSLKFRSGDTEGSISTCTTTNTL